MDEDESPTRQAEVVGTGPEAEFKIEDGDLVAVDRRDDPRSARERYGDHLQKARAGDPSELPAVERSFAAAAKHDARLAEGRIEGEPMLPQMIRLHGDDPLERAENAVIRRLARGTLSGLYCEEALRVTLEEFKSELLGPNPSAIEDILVDSIGLAYLDSMGVEEQAARTDSGDIELLDFLDKRKSRATKRLHSGLQALALIRRKVTPAVAVQVNVAGSPALMAGPGPEGIEQADGQDRLRLVDGGELA